MSKESIDVSEELIESDIEERPLVKKEVSNTSKNDAEDGLIVPRISSDHLALIEVTSTKRAVINVLKLSTPLALVNFMQIGGTYGSVLMLSFLNEENLAAIGILESTIVLLSSVDVSMEMPVRILAAYNYGQLKSLDNLSNQNDEILLIREKISAILQHGWVLGLLVSVPQMIVMGNIGYILRLFGLPTELCQLVESIAIPYLFSLPANALIKANINFVSAVDKEKYLIPYNLIVAGVGLGASYILIHGINGVLQFGAPGYGYAMIVQSTIGVALFKLFYLANRDMKQYKLFQPNIFKHKHYFKYMLKLGSPLVLFSSGSGIVGFVLSIMYGRLGVSKLAIEQSVSQYLTWISGATVALSRSSSILISKAYGAKKYIDIKKYGYLSYAMGGAIYILPTLAFTLFPLELASVYIKNDLNRFETLIRITFALGLISSFGSTLRTLASQNLSGLQDTLYPSLMSILPSVLIILPLAYLMGTVFKMNIVGIDTAICVGVIISTFMLIYRWGNFSSDAKKEPLVVEVSDNNEEKATQNIDIKNVKQNNDNLPYKYWSNFKTSMLTFSDRINCCKNDNIEHDEFNNTHDVKEVFTNNNFVSVSGHG